MLNPFYDNTPSDSTDAFLANFKGKALRSPTRPTVPLLDMTLHAPSALLSIVSACGAEPTASFRFEYETFSSPGSTRPSRTDLMVLGKSTALAVEAKWTEASQMTVATRVLRRTELRRNDESAQALGLDRQHQETEVGAWLAILQRLTPKSLTTERMSDSLYQIIRRAASAVATGLLPTVLYLHFQDVETKSGTSDEVLKSELSRLSRKLGSHSGLKLYLASQPIRRLPTFRAIENLDKTELATADAVRAALKAGPLFHYGSPTIEQVS
jgi:hypothetical protein